MVSSRLCRTKTGLLVVAFFTRTTQISSVSDVSVSIRIVSFKSGMENLFLHDLFGENEQNLGEETKSPAKMGIIK